MTQPNIPKCNPRTKKCRLLYSACSYLVGTRLQGTFFRVETSYKRRANFPYYTTILGVPRHIFWPGLLPKWWREIYQSRNTPTVSARFTTAWYQPSGTSDDSMGYLCEKNSQGVTPRKTNMTGWKINHLKMYFLLNMGNFLACHVSFRGSRYSSIWDEQTATVKHCRIEVTTRPGIAVCSGLLLGFKEGATTRS